LAAGKRFIRALITRYVTVSKKKKNAATKMENRNHGIYTTPNMEISAFVCVACSRKRTPTNTNALEKHV